MTTSNTILDMDKRARNVFQHIVESFMIDGNPVGSRTLSRVLTGSSKASPATIRNVMSDLEEMGLLQARHTSSGRLPTDYGLKYFVDGILEVGSLSDVERKAMEADCNDKDLSIDAVFEKATATLSELSENAGLVIAPTYTQKALKHIEFIPLSERKAMAVMVSEDDSVENRIMDIEAGMMPDTLREAGAFLSEKLHGKTIAQMRGQILDEIKARRSELNPLMTAMVEAGLATKLSDGKLIVHGRSQLLKDPGALNNLERLKELMDQLESQETVSKILDEASNADGVKIYIGADNPVFEGSGQSLILSPYTNGKDNNIIGAIGVIGPTRLNYAKVIPTVDCMAQILSRRIRGIG